MTLDDFRLLEQRFQREKPKVFQLASPDRPATSDQILAVESAVGARLPDVYRSFLREFGGGEYGFLKVFSADPQGHYYLPRRQREASRYLPPGLLAISDDSAGGFYALRVVDSRAEDEVRYWNIDGGEIGVLFGDILDFVAHHAFR